VYISRCASTHSHPFFGIAAFTPTQHHSVASKCNYQLQSSIVVINSSAMRFKPGPKAAAAIDSDSGRSPSDDEKAIGHGHFSNADGHDLPPDPDEHLSPEERAKIVSYLVTSPAQYLISSSITNSKHIRLKSLILTPRLFSFETV
jgi:hypothetical protein